MEIYKLNHTNKETAMADLIAKGVYIETEEGLIYGQGIHAVVEIGKIVLTNETYDADFKELIAPIFADGYAYDVMSDTEIVFESEIFPTNPRHGFAGCEPIKAIDFEQGAI